LIGNGNRAPGMLAEDIGCESRSNNTSLKRPICLAAPE
jgi:hypothetical protein